MASRAEVENASSNADGEANTKAADAVARSALEKLLSDSQFHVSDRNRRFLRFVAEETLAGRQDRIKAYAIAVDVFGRGSDFDGTLDPIVRIEATRLRAALQAYYAGPGRNEQLRISLPKGGYVPFFELTGSPTPAADTPPDIVSRSDSASLPEVQANQERRLPSIILRDRLVLASLLAVLGIAAAGIVFVTRDRVAPATSARPAIMVEAGQAVATDAASGQIATGFAQSLTLTLSRFDGIRVLSVPRDVSLSAAVDKFKAGAGEPTAVYTLETSVRQQDQSIRFWWKLVDVRSGETVWTDTADRSFSNGMTIPLEDEIAAKIATVIGQPHGLVAMRQMGIERVYPTQGYGCVLRARAYYLAISEALHREIRDCLEQAVAVAPDYAEAWAMLAFVYLDEDRNAFNRRSTAGDALRRAVSSAQRASELAPFSETAQEALMAVYYRKGDFDAALSAGRRALEINPQNPELMSALGVRLFARGQWDEGSALVRKAVGQMLIVPPLDRVTLVLDAYRSHDYDAALEQAQLINLPNYYAGPLLRAAIYGQLGNAAEARANVQALLAIRPNYTTEMRAELRARHYTEPLIDMLADGLKKAGLDVQ